MRSFLALAGAWLGPLVVTGGLGPNGANVSVSSVASAEAIGTPSIVVIPNNPVGDIACARIVATRAYSSVLSASATAEIRAARCVASILPCLAAADIVDTSAVSVTASSKRVCHGRT